MCVMSYYSPGTEPVEAHLTRGAAKNDDGHGWAMLAGDGVLTYKSMKARDAIDSFLEMREAHPETHALFHSRWATHGVTDESNVHPFTYRQDSLTVLAHNGVLSGLNMRKGERRSDTRYFAESVAPRLPHLDREGAGAAIAPYLNHGKLIILTANPRYRHRAYILGETRGEWVSDVWWSNGDWEAPRTGYAWLMDSDWREWGGATIGKAPRAGSVQGGAGEHSQSCEFCGAIDDYDTVNRLCWQCMSCGDCANDMSDCECYVPESLGAAQRDAARDWLREYDSRIDAMSGKA